MVTEVIFVLFFIVTSSIRDDRIGFINADFRPTLPSRPSIRKDILITVTIFISNLPFTPSLSSSPPSPFSSRPLLSLRQTREKNNRFFTTCTHTQSYVNRQICARVHANTIHVSHALIFRERESLSLCTLCMRRLLPLRLPFQNIAPAK